MARWMDECMGGWVRRWLSWLVGGLVASVARGAGDVPGDGWAPGPLRS